MEGGDGLPTFITFSFVVIDNFSNNLLKSLVEIKFSVIAIILYYIIAEKFVREKFSRAQPAVILYCRNDMRIYFY